MLNCEPHLRPRPCLAPPIEREQQRKPIQQLARHLLDLLALLCRQVRPRARQNVEDRQLRLRESLTQVPLLLRRQTTGKEDKLLQNLLDTPTPVVIALDELLELLQ